jgi:urea carboxylase
MFQKILIANRGEIACRIINTLDRLQIASVAVYSSADVHAQHVLMATEAHCIGSASAADSYLKFDRILEVAKQTGAAAIHPGYGFLSENAEFAEACAQANIVFIGPTPTQLRQFGLKHTARELAAAQNIPLCPGTPLLENVEVAKIAAQSIGYPIMLKSTAGGGGIGLQVCLNEIELAAAFHKIQRLSQNNFSQSGIYLEKYIETARHIEVQIFGDGRGQVLALGERDCSTQRRNQKVIEETPAPGISESLRQKLTNSAVQLGRSVNYQSAGTVEFVYDVQTQKYYFLEVNTRLQVEHGVTEEVWGIDLVEWMIRQAAGEQLSLNDYQPQGHAIQVRIYAEDPHKNCQPSAGMLHQVSFPGNVRCDRWITTGTEITPYYDPLLAKLIVRGSDRAEAISKLQQALEASSIYGIVTNLDYLKQILASPKFAAAELSTQFLANFAYQPQSIEVIDPGTYSSIQDYPGRTGYWDIGVPPSGPMDHLALRLANTIVGNLAGTAALEFTVTGATLRFHSAAVICLAGAQMTASIDGVVVPYWQALAISANSILKIKDIPGAGYRTYLAVQGGLDVPDYLGSKSTFLLGKFGGHAGRALRSGDVIKLHQAGGNLPTTTIDTTIIPTYSNHWQIGVLYGPHAAPDFFTTDDIEMFFNTDWQVHYNSTRTGIRLIGPKPQWARTDGGEAGLHPSNIHDNAYAIGSIDFTGDMPVILGPDGPSLGGFVCPAVIVQAELWKMGQLKPGDTVRFQSWSWNEAAQQERIQDQMIASLQAQPMLPITSERTSPILHQNTETQVVYRQAGDKYLLVEYGDLVLDINLRFRVHVLMEWLKDNLPSGVIDLTPGIRSLQIHYDSRVLSQSDLLTKLLAAETQLPAITEISVPSRIVHLPLSWADPATLLAIEKYMQSVRADAPWCPSNIEFIRRINGLETIQEVYDIVFNASYLVLGLGDVYLGAPVATPIDPRQRLVTTKYNPARTWTPENAVGIGGAYLCVYGMEGPGGYQFVGRTVQMWNRFQRTKDFTNPWLLRFFDQLRFYPVSEQELLQLRADFLVGKFQLKIEETTFSLQEYQQFLGSIDQELTTFKNNQQAAFQAERERWALAGEFMESIEEEIIPELTEEPLPAGAEAINAHISANVWQLSVELGTIVVAGDQLLILEAMKMEIPVMAEISGVVVAIYCQPGQTITAGQRLLGIKPQVNCSTYSVIL